MVLVRSPFIIALKYHIHILWKLSVCLKNPNISKNLRDLAPVQMFIIYCTLSFSYFDIKFQASLHKKMKFFVEDFFSKYD